LAEYVLERVAADEFDFFALEVLMSGNVVERSFDALYSDFLHELLPVCQNDLFLVRKGSSGESSSWLSISVARVDECKQKIFFLQLFSLSRDNYYIY
jgi:hypothetical protein